jgi:hypothetical protein
LASGNGVRNVLAGSIFAAAQEGGAAMSKTRRCMTRGRSITMGFTNFASWRLAVAFD